MLEGVGSYIDVRYKYKKQGISRFNVYYLVYVATPSTFAFGISILEF